MKRFSLKSLAVVGIAALALTACGGSGEDDALNVGQTSNSVAFFPLHVAEENGYFDDEGVTLGDRPRLQTGARLAAALTSDSIDVAAGVATDAFNFADNDDDALITGALVTEYYVDIVVGNDFDGASEDDSLEDKIRSLEGKTIGITGPGSGTEALLIYLFNEVGLDANADATLVNLDASPSAAIGALENDQKDARFHASGLPVKWRKLVVWTKYIYHHSAEMSHLWLNRCMAWSSAPGLLSMKSLSNLKVLIMQLIVLWNLLQLNLKKLEPCLGNIWMELTRQP